jgi:hypothetical protein
VLELRDQLGAVADKHEVTDPRCRPLPHWLRAASTYIHNDKPLSHVNVKMPSKSPVIHFAICHSHLALFHVGGYRSGHRTCSFVRLFGMNGRPSNGTRYRGTCSCASRHLCVPEALTDVHNSPLATQVDTNILLRKSVTGRAEVKSNVKSWARAGLKDAPSERLGA